MAEPARHLHLVDPETGEIVSSCPACAVKDDEIAGLQRDIRGWAYRYAELKREKEAEARKSPLWPLAVELFSYWREKCNHPRSGWSFDRFEQVAPFLKAKEYGKTERERFELCKRAIDGAAFDPYTTTRKNGTTCRHDGWDLVFRNRSKYEEFCNRAPIARAV